MSTATTLRTSLILALLLILGAALGACSQQDAAETPTVRSTEGVVVDVTEGPAPTATPRPTATPTPEPTPIVPAAAISAQALDQDAILLVDSVVLPEPGWLAIYTLPTDGGEGRLVGAVSLDAGPHEDITVPLEPVGLTSTLIARLHVERENPETLDYPGADDLVAADFGVPVEVDLSALRPSVEIDDQAIARDGIVRVGEAQVLTPSWLLIHADDDGPTGPVLGKLLLAPGHYEDLTIGINWREATPTLYAVFHEDSDRPGLLDYPGGDLPMIIGDGPVMTEFNVKLPLAILVYDQPVVDGAVVIERVVSDGPGWITIQADDGSGQPGVSIGASPLADGVNRLVVIDVDEYQVTSQLFARLHEDTEPGDSFNYPNADPPVLEDDRLPMPTVFYSDPDSHAMVNDQAVIDGKVTVAFVAAMQEAWVVVRAEQDGGPGEVLGQTWVPVGISRDVVVEIDPDTAPGTLYVVLHRDRGELKEFEFPDGSDDPLLDNQLPIALPFTLLAASDDVSQTQP